MVSRVECKLWYSKYYIVLIMPNSDWGWLWCRHRHGEVLQHQVSLLRPETPRGGAGSHCPSPEDARRRTNSEFSSASQKQDNYFSDFLLYMKFAFLHWEFWTQHQHPHNHNKCFLCTKQCLTVPQGRTAQCDCISCWVDVTEQWLIYILTFSCTQLLAS